MTTTRAIRIRRALAISSAAIVVAVTAAACDAASASTGDGQHAGHVQDPQGAAGQQHRHDVVPLAQARQAEDADNADTTENAEDADNAAINGDNGDDEDQGQQQGQQGQLDILGTDCDDSDLERHDGFQKAPRCVETSFGEVAEADKSPSLLITDAPRRVRAGQPFNLVVSTRNLVRDRFLGAAVGGYYAESSFLNEEGIQRGHFHTACRMLATVDEAPDAAPDPAFFVATQDNRGGAGEDKVTVEVTGMPQRGTAQCAVWAGDGSHRVPMMERANQTPAFDVVRVEVQ